MDPRKLIEALSVAERLKDTTRHCYTKNGRRESVAEHCWLMTLAAFWMKDEFPEADMDRVLKMCLIHDIGEAVTGDIPAFLKTEDNEKAEQVAVNSLLSTLPPKEAEELALLFEEINDLSTPEARLFKSLDNMEAIISHNEAPISTWLPREFDENLTYGTENCSFSPWTRAMREELKNDSLKKINEYLKLQNAKKD